MDEHRDSSNVAAALVVSCGTCRIAPDQRQGLRCRISGGVVVEASCDDEHGVVTCVVPSENAIPGFSYEVLDGNGNVLCKSANSCLLLHDPFGRSKKHQSTCDGETTQDGKTCEEPLVVSAAPGGAPLSAAAAALRGLGWVDRLLPVWILLAMALGVLLGVFVPGVRDALAVAEIGGVSLPIALGLWAMMLPVLSKVRYELLGTLLRNKTAARQLALSAALNWLLGPALMTALAWACLPDLPGYRNGVIMVGLARCIAMVLIWNDLAGGDAELCAVMVALNSVLQIVLYAPLSLLYLQVVSGGVASVGFWPVAKSVLLFLGVPLVAGVLLRYGLIAVRSRPWFEGVVTPWISPVALLGLLYTVVVLFAVQGANIVSQLGSVARVAVPMLIYFLSMFVVSLFVSRAAHDGYAFSVTQAFTAASNNFELAIAVAVGTFGVASQEALAATVGPLIEVPVLLGLVYVALALRTRLWPGGDAAVTAAGAAEQRAADAAASCPSIESSGLNRDVAMVSARG